MLAFLSRDGEPSIWIRGSTSIKCSFGRVRLGGLPTTIGGEGFSIVSPSTTGPEAFLPDISSSLLSTEPLVNAGVKGLMALVGSIESPEVGDKLSSGTAFSCLSPVVNPLPLLMPLNPDKQRCHVFGHRGVFGGKCASC